MNIKRLILFSATVLGLFLGTFLFASAATILFPLGGGTGQDSSAWTGLVGVNSGTWYRSATSSASAANAVVFRDANQNAFAQNFVSAGTSFPTNGGSVTLTAASPRSWIFTGTNTQTMKLPSGLTLSVGATYTANNNSTGAVTVVDNGSNTLAVVPTGGKTEFVISNVGSANGTWDAHALLGHGNNSGTDGLSLGTTSPWGMLAINPIAGEFSNQFVVGSSTATAFLINNSGYAGISTTSPGSIFSIGTGTGINFNTTSTSTIPSNLHVGGNLQVDGNFFAPVSLQVTGDTDFGGHNITNVGTLSLNTPLGISSGGTNASSFTTSGNGIYWNGTSLLTAPLTSAVTYPYASSTAMSAGNIMSTATLSIGTTTAPTLFSIGNALTNGGLYFNTTGFAIGSSTPTNPFSVLRGALAFIIKTTGEIIGYDATNLWNGRISPTHSFVLTVATTTTWTASTTGSSYTPTLSMPFAGTLKQVRCTATSSQAFLGINPFINTTPTTPSYFVSSTTVGTEKFTGANTFNAGDVIGMNVGTTTSDANAKGVSCTFDIIETP